MISDDGAFCNVITSGGAKYLCGLGLYPDTTLWIPTEVFGEMNISADIATRFKINDAKIYASPYKGRFQKRKFQLHSEYAAESLHIEMDIKPLRKVR